MQPRCRTALSPKCLLCLMNQHPNLQLPELALDGEGGGLQTGRETSRSADGERWHDTRRKGVGDGIESHNKARVRRQEKCTVRCISLHGFSKSLQAPVFFPRADGLHQRGSRSTVAVGTDGMACPVDGWDCSCGDVDRPKKWEGRKAVGGRVHGREGV